MLLDRLFKTKKPKGRITGINIRFMGETHTLPGKEITGSTMEIEIPFQNKIGGNLLPDMLKVPPITVEKVDVAQPFKLLDTEPKLPAKVEFMSRVTFKLRVAPPQTGYSGPMSVSFSNSSSDLISINVNEVTISSKSDSIALDDSAFIMNLQKGQIFKKSVQMFKLFGYNDMVDSVGVSKPFEVVSTSPRMPISLDHKDSYIVDIYIKAPDFNYAGGLDIKFG